MLGEKFRWVAICAAVVAVCLVQKSFAQGDTSFENKLSAEALSVRRHMDPDIKNFLGSGTAPDSCSDRKISLSEFVTERMILPDDIYGRDIGSGRKLYIGHMPHNATDVAAVIYGSDGKISAVAAVFCEWKKAEDPAKTRTSHAIVYVRDDAMKDENVTSLKAWGELFQKLNRDPAGLSPRIQLMPVKRK